ncbi:uncharacterized protein LOC114538228 [Dendronephthya gigantea]|uniref:uncharacterized protein LOC114538228 n=1 Tax=Dendronephthya gigantea TaxID=151771 RepID=UPI001069137C|nr:uncharacterized protein LOC114538228 [Dendronephthya gigantea]
MNLYQKYNEQSPPTILHIFFCIIALAFWLVFASIALPFLFVFNVFKWAVAAWILYNRIGKLLASEDVPFMHESEHNRNYSICLFMVKGKPDVEKLRELFHDRVIMNDGHPSYKRLRQKIVKKYGRYVWADEDNFDLSHHIITYEGDRPADEEELAKLFGEIASKPLPRDISPWQVVVIPMKIDGLFAFYTCGHHIIGDGISLVGVFSKIMDDKPVLLKPSEKSIKKYESSAFKRVLHGIFTGPLSLLTVALSSAKNPFPRSVNIVGEQKVAWTAAISLPKIKEVKTRIGATINDVVTGCLAGAVRRYIKTTTGQCSEDVQIAVSINTRPPSLLLKENIPLENNSTGVIFNLPVSKESVHERIHESMKRMDAIKNSSDFLVFGFIFNTVLANLPEFLGRFTVNSLNRHCCLIMSNVPGPLNKMVIGGNEVVSLMVWPPLIGGTGVSTAIFSYADTIRLNIKADTSVFPEPKLLADYFEKEVEELFKTYAKKDD